MPSSISLEHSSPSPVHPSVFSYFPFGPQPVFFILLLPLCSPFFLSESYLHFLFNFLFSLFGYDFISSYLPLILMILFICLVLFLLVVVSICCYSLFPSVCLSLYRLPSYNFFFFLFILYWTARDIPLLWSILIMIIWTNTFHLLVHQLTISMSIPYPFPLH